MPADSMNVLKSTEEAMFLHPMGDKVLVKPVETPDEMKVGAFSLKTPEQVKAVYPSEGVVLECGPECPMVEVPTDDGAGQKFIETRPLLEPGQRVIFTKYTGLQVSFGADRRYLLIPFGDICGYMDEEAPVLEKPKPSEWVPRA